MNQLLNLLDLISVALGLMIVFITYRAGKINSQTFLYYLSLGFGVISFGSLLENYILHQLTNSSIRMDHLFESIFVNIGFLIIWFALKEDEQTRGIENPEENTLEGDEI